MYIFQYFAEKGMVLGPLTKFYPICWTDALQIVIEN